MVEEDLAKRTCVPCGGSVPKLWGFQLQDFARRLPGWKVVDEHHLTREFTFPDFKGALAFANEVGAIAEAQNHHPEILVAWGKVVITLWTHKIDGLSEADFVLAAKIGAEG